MAMSREDIKKFIDIVPEEKLIEFEKVIHKLVPLDDELLTEEEKQAIREGREEFERGETISWEDAMRELDL